MTDGELQREIEIVSRMLEGWCEKNSVRNRSESRFQDPHNLLKRGSMASRKASPITLNVKTATIMTIPGTTDIKG